MKVEITFTEPVLGTLAGDPEIATEFILAKNAEGVAADEVEALPDAEAIEKSSTIFPRMDGVPFIWDYQWKGFFKSAFEVLCTGDQHTKESLKKARISIWMLQKTVDKMIFVNPRRTPVIFEGKTDFLERPLRGKTMKGERVCLARSERIPTGATCEIEIKTLNQNLWPYIEESLDYGELMGMLQWRSGPFSDFLWCAGRRYTKPQRHS